MSVDTRLPETGAGGVVGAAVGNPLLGVAAGACSAPGCRRW